ncbi:homocysteine-responsive endoplasmic reticulum-resident ubiquitin-like domain member 2 protein [Ctenocephalides felis]|nr:homocysteine-responsive endoplasmic reticulum-resident ubiquitin-like domain member 2 protein [Ctenocephalides felis]
MEAVPVTLIVKAPNQQIEDQTIQCELSWTIKKLKGYLSEVYPSKPSTEEQKLIYSGKLLSDTVVLKDILRRYEGQDTHTVHLVCIPKNDNIKVKTKCQTKGPVIDPIPTNQRENASTTYQRILSNSSTSSSSEAINQQYGQRNDLANTQPVPQWNNVNGTPSNQVVVQNLLWLNQVYTQYITQYMQILQHGMVPENAYLQMLQTNSINIQSNSRISENDTAPQAPNDPEVEQAAAAAPINAVGVGIPADEVEGERDWLDWFYFLSRIMVLFSIVYFYSSPIRFLVVLILGTLVHLYQIGFFRNVMAEIHNENNNAPNANAPNNNEIVDNIDQNQETPTFSTHTSTTQQITPNDDRPHLFTIL